MGAPQEILEEIFTVIEGGNVVGDSAEIIQFPSDNGQNTFSVVQKTVQGANGTGVNYWVSAVASGASAVSAGALMITTSFPEFVALAVPCLGIAIGTIWYNLAPEFWNSVSEKLVNAGYTLRGKVVTHMDLNGNLVLPTGAVQILSDSLIDAGVFTPGQTVLPDEEQSELFNPGIYENVNFNSGIASNVSYYSITGELIPAWFEFVGGSRTIKTGLLVKYDPDYSRYEMIPIAASEAPFTVNFSRKIGSSVESYTLTGSQVTRNETSYYVARTGWGAPIQGLASSESYAYTTSSPSVDWNTFVWDIMYISENGTYEEGMESVLQQGATYPEKNKAFGDLYPGWVPVEFPIVYPSPGIPYQLPAGMPVEYPEILPIEQPYQKEAQNPDENVETNPDKVAETITDPNHDPRNKEGQRADDESDPETGDAEDPIAESEADNKENPVDPDPPTPPSPGIPVPFLPSTVSSSKMFTVYNPTSSQLDQLGGYLWDRDLIDILKKIWQDPLDGIISLGQVYCTPATGGTHNIILGYLDSGVSSKVVSSQFVTIDCGAITIDELNQNATDYNPYTSLQIYLPFIGITELDVNDFMSGTISVKYHVDVYTGTCLAEVKVTRTRDVPNGGIVYTFGGNCSQQLPLTSGDAKGLFGALVSAVGVGIGVASGGANFISALGAMGKDAAQNVASREMLHVNHSGNLSANAGIMGQKKPYVIITRQKPYNANSYNKFYGFPCNKTVFLSNFSGYARVKAARLRSKATEDEKTEIMELCRGGIIL